MDWSSLKHAHYWSIRLRGLTKSKKCPQNSFSQWGYFSSTCILNKLYFLVYFMCTYQHNATFSQFLSPLTIKMVWWNSLLWEISQAVHSSAAPVWYMLFWPREGSQGEFGQLGIWLQMHLQQIHPSNWVSNVQVETHQGQCFVFKCLTKGSSESPIPGTPDVIEHLVMVLRKSQSLREEES